MGITQSKSMERLIDRRSAAGICISCGKPKESGEKRLKCKACRERQNAEVKRIYDARAALGICIQCGVNSAMAGKRNCEQCREYHVNYLQSRYRQLASQHRCTACGEKLPENYYYTRCPKCKEQQSRRHKALYQERKAERTAVNE